MRAPNPAGQPTLDGRAARSARTRDAVVRALLALISEGDLRPDRRPDRRAGRHLAALGLRALRRPRRPVPRRRPRAAGPGRRPHPPAPGDRPLPDATRGVRRPAGPGARGHRRRSPRPPRCRSPSPPRSPRRRSGAAARPRRARACLADELANLDADDPRPRASTLRRADHVRHLGLPARPPGLSPPRPRPTLATSLRLLLRPDGDHDGGPTCATMARPTTGDTGRLGR